MASPISDNPDAESTNAHTSERSSSESSLPWLNTYIKQLFATKHFADLTLHTFTPDQQSHEVCLAHSSIAARSPKLNSMLQSWPVSYPHPRILHFEWPLPPISLTAFPTAVRFLYSDLAREHDYQPLHCIYSHGQNRRMWDESRLDMALSYIVACDVLGIQAVEARGQEILRPTLTENNVGRAADLRSELQQESRHIATELGVLISSAVADFLATHINPSDFRFGIKPRRVWDITFGEIPNPSARSSFDLVASEIMVFQLSWEHVKQLFRDMKGHNAGNEAAVTDIARAVFQERYGLRKDEWSTSCGAEYWVSEGEDLKGFGFPPMELPAVIEPLEGCFEF